MSSSKEETPSSSEPVSSTPVSSQPVTEQKVLLEGKTIASICSEDTNTFVLTAEGKVYFYGAYQEGLSTIAKASRQNPNKDGDLYELSFPEPIVKLVPYAAIGESGALYIFLYPATAAWNMHGAALPSSMATIKLNGKIKDICYSYGDFFLVTEKGELYSIGEMTLYGQGFKAEPEAAKRLKPIKAGLPEQADQVIATDDTVFVQGKSGKVYMAFRYINDGPDTFIPDTILKDFPYRYDKSLFQPVDAGTVSQIAVDFTDRGKVVYLLKPDGSVLFWDADQTTWEAYMPGYQSEKKPGKPDIVFAKLENTGGTVNQIISSANSEYACFLAENGQCVLFRNGTRVSGFKETVKAVCLTKNGILFTDESGKLLFYGTDHEKLIVENNQNTAQEITLFDHSFK